MILSSIKQLHHKSHRLNWHHFDLLSLSWRSNHISRRPRFVRFEFRENKSGSHLIIMINITPREESTLRGEMKKISNRVTG